MAKVLTIWRKITYRDVFVYVCDIVIKLERKLQDAKVLTAKLVARSTVWIVQLYVTLSRRCLTSFQALTQLQKDIVSKNTFPFIREKKKGSPQVICKAFSLLATFVKREISSFGLDKSETLDLVCVSCVLHCTKVAVLLKDQKLDKLN